MAAPAGSLVVRIGADTSGLNRGARQAESRMSKMRGGALKAAAGVAALGAAAVAAGAAILGGLVKSGLAAVDAHAKLARQLDGTIAGVRTLTNAAGDAGVSEDIMAQAAERLNARLGEAQRGSGQAREAIDRLGLSARELSEMDVDERFAAMADRVHQLGLSSSQTADFLRQLGIRNFEIVNLMRQGGDAIRAERDEVQNLGLALSEIDAAQVERANDAMGVFADVLTGIKDRLAVRSAPFIEYLSERFRTVALEAGGFGDTVAAAMSVVGRYMAVAVDIGAITIETFRRIYGVVTDVVSAIGDGFAWLAEDFRKAVNQIIRGLNQVADFLPLIEGGIEEIQPGWIGRRFEDTMGAAENAVAFSMEAIREYLGGELPSEGLERWLEEIQRVSREGAAAAVAASGNSGVSSDGEGIEIDEKEAEAFQRRIDAIRGRFLTEEELQREHLQIMSDIKRAWETGEFETEEEYRNVKEQAEAEHLERLKNLREKNLTDLERFTNASFAKQVDIASGHLADMTASVANENKKMFRINQIAGIANAIVSAYEGISKTLAAYPWPLSGAMAALQATAAFAQVNAIKSAKFGGTGGSAPSLAGGTPAPPVSPVGGGTPGQGDFVQDVSVTLIGAGDNTASLIEQLGQTLSDNGGRIGKFKVMAA